jgi:hypothetical protein
LDGAGIIGPRPVGPARFADTAGAAPAAPVKTIPPTTNAAAHLAILSISPHPPGSRA